MSTPPTDEYFPMEKLMKEEKEAHLVEKEKRIKVLMSLYKSMMAEKGVR